jgi:hypothetical protein
MTESEQAEMKQTTLPRLEGGEKACNELVQSFALVAVSSCSHETLSLLRHGLSFDSLSPGFRFASASCRPDSSFLVPVT